VAGPRIVVTEMRVDVGFLGSGKTTLVNRMLREPGGRRIAVIENEVGAISIDHDLLKCGILGFLWYFDVIRPVFAVRRAGEEGRPAKDVFVLKNGCVCCTAASDGNELEHTLDVLLKLSESGPESFNYVVIECSGIRSHVTHVRTPLHHRARLCRLLLQGLRILHQSFSYFSAPTWRRVGLCWMALLPSSMRSTSHSTCVQRARLSANLAQ
jgi:hypothetical protein